MEDVFTNRRRLLVLGICILMVLGCLMSLGFYRSSEDVHPVTKEETTKNFLRTSAVISNIRSSIQSGYPHVIISTVHDDEDTIGYSVASYGYRLILPYTQRLSLTISSATATSIGNQQVLQKLVAATALIFTKNNFKSIQTNTTNAALFQVEYFHNPTSDCQITRYTVIDIACASSSQVELAMQTARPLMQALMTSNPSYSVTAIATPTVQASITPGYTVALLPVYGSSGETIVYLYREQLSDWQVVNGLWFNDPHEDGDIEPNCIDFDNVPAIKAAFSGKACYNSATRAMSIIQ